MTMKHFKLLGLAVIAVLGLMAFGGADTVSATTLCKTNITPCPAGWDWPVGTSMHDTKKRTLSVTSPPGTTVSQCEETTETSALEQTSAPVLSFSLHTRDWTKCTTTVKNITTGKLTVKWLKENEAEVVSDEMKVTFVLGGISCTYTTGEGTKLGTFKGGSEPTMKIETKIKKAEGSFACPSEPTLDSEVVITEPNPIFVTE